MGEWQPIETAPKDGTMIDVWMVRREYGTTETFDGRRIADVWWGTQYYGTDTDRTKKPEAFVCKDGGWDSKCEYSDAWKITHWMPLPQPPST